MNASPTPAPAPPDDPAEDAQYYRQVLHELIDKGLGLARLVHAEAQHPSQPNPSPTPAADAAIAFDRISRAIRRTILLARHLDLPVQRKHASRRRIIREVEDAIARSERRPAERDSLQAEFLERLEGPDLEDDIDHRPAADIVADICRDLGIAGLPESKPWKRRTPADIAALCARAAQPPAQRPPARNTGEPERFFRLLPVPNGA